MPSGDLRSPQVVVGGAMSDVFGVLAAVLSSSIGGLSVGVTRFVVGATDPITLGAFRFGIGAALLLPFALRQRHRWPDRPALVPIAALGLLYFALFPILFNASLIYTTAARGSLALSTLPVLTMLVGAFLRAEPLTLHKSTGVALAMIGVGIALLTNLGTAPAGAWRGDLLMVAAAFCMAFYSVWSRPLALAYGTIVYTTLAMATGGLALTGIAWAHGGFARANDTNAGRHLRHGEPDCIRDLRCLCLERAHHSQLGGRSCDRGRWYRSCHLQPVTFQREGEQLGHRACGILGIQRGR